MFRVFSFEHIFLITMESWDPTEALSVYIERTGYISLILRTMLGIAEREFLIFLAIVSLVLLRCLEWLASKLYGVAQLFIILIYIGFLQKKNERCTRIIN
jgi:hypothetical protein